MNGLLGNPWTVTIIGGLIVTVFGGLAATWLLRYVFGIDKSKADKTLLTTDHPSLQMSSKVTSEEKQSIKQTRDVKKN
ncbi:MAG: hypothetical protein M1150_00495 [Patescibacteria group bacterium]|nr:hypothetical protein [Patescibacteria group bacterium]